MIRVPPIVRRLRALLADRRAATAVEYGLICALIVLAALGGIKAMAGGAISIWNGVSSNIVGAR